MMYSFPIRRAVVDATVLGNKKIKRINKYKKEQ